MYRSDQQFAEVDLNVITVGTLDGVEHYFVPESKPNPSQTMPRRVSPL